jgi:hypothetical protein
MSTIIYPSQIDFSWMVGRKVTAVTTNETTEWDFWLGESFWLKEKINVNISTYCPWRILRHGRIVCGIGDHRRYHDSPASVDALTIATELLSPLDIAAVELRETVGDILINFSEPLRLEILPVSDGNAGWQIKDPQGRRFYFQAGGRICIFKS